MLFKNLIDNAFKFFFLRMMQNKDNPYHPLVWINGDPVIGGNTYIGGFTEINAKGAKVTIGSGCDIASFVSINVADSHKLVVGHSGHNIKKDIHIGKSVFIGSHSVVLGGVMLGDRCVVAAGTIVRPGEYPSYSLITNIGVKKGYYRYGYSTSP